jgi:hypothetical protein
MPQWHVITLSDALPVSLTFVRQEQSQPDKKDGLVPVWRRTHRRPAYSEVTLISQLKEPPTQTIRNIVSSVS